MCVIWLSDSRAGLRLAHTSIQTPGQEKNIHGHKEGKNENMKRKIKCLGLSVCLYLQRSLSRKAMDVLFLAQHPRKSLPLQNVKPTSAPRLGFRCQHGGWTLAPFPSAISWIQVATSLALSPFHKHTQ